jgi:hypothetical protein
MRAVSDFLDRVAARAIGGEPMLTPRLPSLFEPMQPAAGIAPPEEAASASATPAHALVHEEVAQRDVPKDNVVRIETVVSPAPRNTPAEPVSPRERTPVPGERLPVIAAVRPVTPPSENAKATPSAKPTREVHATDDRLVVRERYLWHESPTASALPHEEAGALLPPRMPVFRSRQDSNGADASAAARRAPTATAEATRTNSEPVVHVSIGRLEVRAAPAAAATPRRQEGPRSSLDDYLRQRGKPTP